MVEHECSIDVIDILQDLVEVKVLSKGNTLQKGQELSHVLHVCIL